VNYYFDLHIITWAPMYNKTTGKVP